MEAQPHDLNVPLLVDKEKQWTRQQQIRFAPKVEEVESSGCEDNPRGCTSFFKTCFNGLNALSGSSD